MPDGGEKIGANNHNQIDQEDQFKFIVAASICILIIIVQIVLSFLWSIFYSKVFVFCWKER